MPAIYPVIMAGGSGTRLWPLSRKKEPKQYQALISERTMLEETCQRLSGISAADVAPLTVICAQHHAEQVRSLVAKSDARLGRLVLEPEGRNTAPVAIVASRLVAEDDPDGLVLLLPADHHIADHAGFGRAVDDAVGAAVEGALVTFGIAPDRPETGYGYIRAADERIGAARRVAAFVEKPDPETARTYLADGAYTWNAGIFLFSARSFLEEAAAHAPEMLDASDAALAASPRDDDVIPLDAETFATVPANSIDYAIMERTEQAAVVGPVSMGWNDIGSWHAVRDLARGLNLGSPATGDTVVLDCKDTYVRSDGPLVAAVGLEGVVVVATHDAVLVLPADRAQDVKQVIGALKARGRDDLL